jgi:hypothetical protein
MIISTCSNGISVVDCHTNKGMMRIAFKTDPKIPGEIYYNGNKILGVTELNP